jgi:ligand-binding sensor domain-containing protein/class 3 adenylate cyclase
VFSGKVWSSIDTLAGLSDNRVLALFEDRLKNLWVGTEKGISKKVVNGFMNYSESDGLISNRVRAIGQDDLGNMWFGTQSGVSRFDGTEFRSFVGANGLSNERIRHILKDRSGNMWFGTYFGGICRFSGEQFIHFRQRDGLSSNQVLSVFEHSDGHIWLGTLDGVSELEPSANGSYEVVTAPLGSELSERSFNIIKGHPNGQIWFGTDQGILIKEGDKTSWFQADGSVFEEEVKMILFEKDGGVWVGTTQGATRFVKKDNGFSFDQYHSNPDNNKSEVSCLLEDGLGRVWIGYINAQLVLFDGSGFVVPELPAALTDISSIAKAPNGKLWIATEGGGLFRHLPSKDPIKMGDFEHFGVQDGLSSPDVRLLIFDKANDLWVGTASGIDQLEFNNLDELKSVKHFGRAEGFIGTETNRNAACVDDAGNLWVGTISGATRYDPDQDQRILPETKLHITNVNLGFDEVDWSKSEFAKGTDGYFALPTQLELPFRLNNLSIKFNAIDLSNPEQVRYQWKVTGYSDEWSPVDGNRTVTLTNIPSGPHEFMVRSCNSAGEWNQVPRSFKFTVLPPFYLTWWFIVVAVVTVVALVFIIIKIREKRFEEDKLRLQRMVDERTVELRHEKERSDELLLNILPHETAEELKLKGFASVQLYDRVSVLFTDFVGFTNITEGITSKELVSSLDEHFRLFDGIMDKYGIEKIKTIGDAYMAAGGIPTRNNSNPISVVAAGLEMIHRLKELNEIKESRGQTAWLLRLGIHTGSVISGVVGKNKFAFDIWGDAVNTAARMESSGDVMQVNVSGSTYQLIKDYFECTPRGKIKAKNKGEIEMYFVDRIKPEFSATEDGFLPNSTFLQIIRSQDENILHIN